MLTAAVVVQTLVYNICISILNIYEYTSQTEWLWNELSHVNEYEQKLAVNMRL